MRDNHLHTHFSYDCQTAFEDYINGFTGEFITTEHFDLSNPYTGQDDVPDYSAYCQKIDYLNQKYGNRFKKGIEIGYFKDRESDILDYLKNKEFDLKLLSIHHNGRYDYLQEEALKVPTKELLADYFNRMEFAIGRVEAHVLAHFDYGFRKLNLDVEDLKPFETQLKRIFRKMLSKGLAFELNTKSLYLYGNEKLYRYTLEILKQLGCKQYSIGSDGHIPEHFCYEFDRLQGLLKDYQIDENHLI